MSTGGSGGSWRFDDEEGAAGEPMEVLADPASSSPGRRPGPTRRQLLFGGAVVLAGGAAWAVSRGSASPPARSAALPSAAPGPGSPRPAPSGPKPRWTYRGTGRLQNDRVAGPTHPPLFLSGADLAQLDPASGSALRHFSVSTAGPLIVGGTLLLDAGGAELDRITAHDLDSGDSDWQYTLPASGSGSGPGQLRALDSDGTTVYCRGESSGGPGPNDPGLTGSTLIAVSLATRQPLWQVPLDHNELALRLAVVPGGRLLVQGTFSTFLLDARDGHRLWTLGGIGWLTADQQWIYASDSSTGLRVLSLADGSVHRTISPGAGSPGATCPRCRATAGGSSSSTTTGWSPRWTRPTAPRGGPASCRSGWTTAAGRCRRAAWCWCRGRRTAAWSRSTPPRGPGAGPSRTASRAWTSGR